MRIVVIGSTGQLGSALLETLPKTHEIIGLSHQEIEVENGYQVSTVIKEVNPDVVINTAAFRVTDQCEEDPNTAFKVNALGARNVAVVCQELNIKIVYISTDYVFDGVKRNPYTEYDKPNPLSIYGKSKLAGENYVKTLCDKHFIIRTAGVFGGKTKNFVETILRLAKERDELKIVYDQIHSPTYTYDLAPKIGELVETSFYGLYHIANKGMTSWFEYAKKILELTHLSEKVKVTKITAKEYGAAALRPSYSVLRNYNLELLGRDDLPSWDNALERYIKQKIL